MSPPPAPEPVKPAPAPEPVKVSPAPAPEPVYAPVGPSSDPASVPIKEPVKSKSGEYRDYVFYIIDLIASIIAITIALLSTRNMDMSSRVGHLVVAILFRYVYIGYFIIVKTQHLKYLINI